MDDPDKLIDGHGVAFADYADLLPRMTVRTSWSWRRPAIDWPPAQPVRDPGAVEVYRYRFTACQMCGADFGRWDVIPELHHIVGPVDATGQRRSDEPCNMIMLCRPCHGLAHEPGNFPAVLYAKWCGDRGNTDWLRLSVLAGRLLPEPNPLEEELAWERHK